MRGCLILWMEIHYKYSKLSKIKQFAYFIKSSTKYKIKKKHVIDIESL